MARLWNSAQKQGTSANVLLMIGYPGALAVQRCRSSKPAILNAARATILATIGFCSLSPNPAHAQTPTPAFPATPIEPSAQPTPQTSDNAAQVRTGSKLGDVQDIVSRLAALLGDHRIPEIEELLEESGHASAQAKLTPAQTRFFKGVIANRENKPQASIQLLQPLVAKLDANLDAPEATSELAGLGPQEKLLRKTLAEDYLRTGDLKHAAQSYRELDAKLGASLAPDERDELELPLKLLPLVANHPPMTVQPGPAFTLPYDRDALGLTDIPVFVDAQSHDWMLDPTAPFNLICRSTAREVGLHVSSKSAIVHTLTGRPIQVHATIIPRFTVGTVTYRNMTAFVYEDSDYYFPTSKYLVRGVLGYPAVSALGSITITANSQVQIEPSPEPSPQPSQHAPGLTKGARFFLDGDRVVVALGQPGNERIFVLDAAGQQTYLSSRYYAEHAADFTNQKQQLLHLHGSPQNTPPTPAYTADSVNLQVGDTPVDFHYLPVLSEPIGLSPNRRHLRHPRHGSPRRTQKLHPRLPHHALRHTNPINASRRHYQPTRAQGGTRGTYDDKLLRPSGVLGPSWF